MKALYDTVPSDVLTINDYQRLAEQQLSPDRLAYIQGGVANETSLTHNAEQFKKITIYNRILSDVSNGSTALNLLDQTFSHPILLAPVAHQSLVLDRGELATLAGAEAADTTMITSTLSSVSLEELASEAKSKHWFQLYFQSTFADTFSLVERAENAGYSALVVTLDLPITAMRYREQRAGYKLPSEIKEVNIDGRYSRHDVSINKNESRIFQGVMQHAPTWSDLEELIRYTTIPVLVKGVSHVDDAVKAINLGATGVVVSNHGGRALDSLPATTQTLPIIRKALGEHIPIFMDGGIRSGGDVFKALALGANAVLIGRPQLYALKVAGALGVAHMLRHLREELEVTMALAGCARLADIGPHCIFKSA